MNSITIHGRLTKDPDLKDYTTAKGESGKLCNYTVAVDRRFGDETDFFECVSYGKLAEVIAKHFHKGKEILVSGEMQCHKYTAKDGTNRYPWRLVGSMFDFCGSKKEDQMGAPQDNEVPEGFDLVDDEDLPF